MRTELPQPEEILEELADKTAAQIQRLAPVAFNSAFREMTRYHRFLLALSASRTPDGAAFNFAEVAGNAWHAPHWIGSGSIAGFSSGPLIGLPTMTTSSVPWPMRPAGYCQDPVIRSFRPT